jgi:hypothetical protein
VPIEISPNNRAGCQNKECKDAGLKVKKGELRFGTWVEFNFGERDIQGWKWRHWYAPYCEHLPIPSLPTTALWILNPCRSCITPTVIQNLLNALGGLEGIEDDLNVIDGYDEIPREWQEKILTMLREGHVPDEDWKGVSDLSQADTWILALNTNSGCRAKPTRQERLAQEGQSHQEKGRK